MAANCVTKQQKRSPEYIGAMDKLDISSSVLELLLFEYQSLPENEEAFSKGELPFPSIEYLQGQLYAPAITVLDGSIIEYYDKYLNDKTFTAKTLQEAKNIAHVIGKRIGHNSVRVVETRNGQYKVLTTRPKLDVTDNIGTFSRESDNIYYNIVRNKNNKENLLITLRQEGLIHRHDTGDRYVLTLNADTKQGSQNDIDSVTRRQLIQQAANKVYLRLESLGFPKNTINIEDTKSGGTAYVDVNENVLEQVKDAVSLGATIQDIKAIYDLADFLGEKFGVKFGGIISLKQANQMTNNAQPNAFIQNNTVYVVANKVTVDTIAEEFLHPFVNTLYQQSPKVFEQLYNEAVALFPNLKTQIYSNYRGRENHKFTATDLMQELVAQALSRHFREEYEQSLLNGPLTVQETLKKMDESENFFTKAWYAIKRLFKELQDKLIGEKYVFEGNDLKNLSLRQVAQLINTSDSSFWTIHDTKQRFNISNERITYTDPLGNAIESLLGIDSIMYRDEVEELAHKICIKISDTLTKIQNDPSIVEVITNGRVKSTPEMSKMTRNKLLQTIGVNDIINYIKELTFGSGNDTIADDMFEMADLLYNNFNTLVSFGMSTFAATEGFSFSLSENTVTVTEDNSSIEDVDEAELSENEGSRQEAWQVESVTKSVIDRMALDVKAELQRCKVLDESGNEVVDRWGLSDNIPLQQATQTILTVTRGSFTLSDMIDKMEKGVKTYPWLQLLLPKLKDKSGQYSSFQSQFYNAMQSHFQLYSVVVNENGKIATKPVNKDTALTEAKRSIVALYNIRQHPLFDSKGAVNKSSLETLKTNLEQLKNKDVEDKLPIVQEVLTILGYDNTDSDFLASIVNDGVVKEISNSLHYIIKGLESHKDDKIITWKPFSADPKDKGIINNISKVIKPFTDVTIDATLSSFHADGKMYQSNKIPSYLTKLFLKFGELSNTVQSATELTPYYKFLQEEYGCTEWFRDNSEDLGVEVNLEMQKGWRLPWLQMLASDPKAREIFAHKVDISFDKKGYMKSSTGKYMNELEYTLMALGEYFSETTSENNLADKVPAWFRVPMQSNKPSADFIRFYSYRGQNYKDAIVKDLLEIFNQELSRMQTCTMRKKEIAKDKSIEISSFDKNGTKFCFLDFLEAKRKDTDFGKLVEKKINGEEVNEAELLSQAELLIRESMEQRVAEMLTEFEANGIVQQASKVKGIDTSNIKEGIENFLWNDFLASINILELTITDVANYKNAEDLQKRLAQIHAPGNRPNIEATDLEGNKVTDGIYRTIILEDFEGFKSNVVENLRYVFDLELAKLPDDNPNKAAAKATYDRIIEQFEKEVNVTDALGYSCPASYRKKALMFGRWSKRHEAIYQKLLKGEFTLTDIEEAFGPLKPFVYSNTTRSSYAENAPIKNLKVGVLYKNSEYMLVMADALIRSVSNGRPNLLQAIFDVMRDSYEKDATKGIDTIQFKSSMKTGISGVLSLNDLVDDPDGYNKAVKRLEDAIYDKNGKDGYNAKHVHASPFEDYCIQQEVPPHFKNHHQAHGSQTRAIIPSDLDLNAKYKVGDLEYTALELIEEYESLIYENIKDSYTDLYRELEWNKDNQYTEEGKANLKRHLSEILKRELLSSQRHSLDLFYACTLRDGDFRVPLGDAVQSNKVEQLINSIIKNRINKQEIAGGPVVQASSFGLSKQLNMVFKDSNGKPLKTLKEFGGTEELYKQYVKDNQGSFSHMEVYAPIYDERLLEFLNADGTIDIKAIEKLNPELLDLVSYRIPTEDKYSIIPCKIVGFVPREAGEVIMMPEEITLLTGSDRKISLFLPV